MNELLRTINYSIIICVYGFQTIKREYFIWSVMTHISFERNGIRDV